MRSRLWSIVISASCFYIGCAGFPVEATEAGIGKLFLTPSQREQINLQRARYCSRQFESDSKERVRDGGIQQTFNRRRGQNKVSAVIMGPNGSLARVNGHYIQQSEAQVFLDKKIMASEVVKIESNQSSKKRMVLSNH